MKTNILIYVLILLSLTIGRAEKLSYDATEGTLISVDVSQEKKKIAWLVTEIVDTTGNIGILARL